MVFPLFPRKIPYRERLKSPFSFFRQCETFFEKKFPQKVPLQFFDVLRQNGCWKMPKGPPFSFFGIVRFFFSPKGPLFPFSFFGIVRLFSEIFFHRSIFWCFATMDVKKCERIPLLARQGPALAGTWCASSVVRLGFSWVWYFEFFDTFMSFCYFWILDMAPTNAVPVLLFICSTWTTHIQNILDMSEPRRKQNRPFLTWIFLGTVRLPIKTFGRLGFSKVFRYFFLWAWYFEFFDILLSFCYFWALDMAPTYAVPGLFTLIGWMITIITVMLNLYENLESCLRNFVYFSQFFRFYLSQTNELPFRKLPKCNIFLFYTSECSMFLGLVESK